MDREIEEEAERKGEAEEGAVMMIAECKAPSAAARERGCERDHHTTAIPWVLDQFKKTS